MDLQFILAQIIGIMVTVSDVIAMQFKDMKWVLAGQILTNLLVAANLALLGGFSGAGICITATVQTVILFVFKVKNIKFPTELSIVFAAIYTACSAIAYKSAYDVISCVAALTFAMSVIQPKSSVFRIYMLVNSLLWIIYDIGVGAYTTILTYVILIVSILIAVVRLDKEEWKGFFCRQKTK